MLKKNVFFKLKFFYFSFIVPFLTEGKVVENPVVWTTNRAITLLENGLVNDYLFYLTLPEKTFYIGFYPNATSEIREITNQDFLTLKGTAWLSNFIVDICFNIYKNENKIKNCVLLTCNTSTTILFQEEANEFLACSLNISRNDTVIMPFLAYNNHFCLAIADIANKNFLFLDPYENEINNSTSTRTFSNFVNFFKTYFDVLYDNSVTNQEWKLSIQNHVTQTDSYNCGVFIIHFFVSKYAIITHFYKISILTHSEKNYLIYC